MCIPRAEEGVKQARRLIQDRDLRVLFSGNEQGCYEADYTRTNDCYSHWAIGLHKGATVSRRYGVVEGRLGAKGPLRSK